MSAVLQAIDPVMRLDEQVRRRIRAVLAHPVAGIERLGVAARGGERIAGALERLEQGGRRLDRQVRELLPLVQRLGQTRPRAGWYQRLVGASLEHDLQLAALRQSIETRMDSGLNERQRLRTQLRLLTQEAAAADIAISATAVDIEAARFLLGPDAVRLRGRARVDETWLRALAARLAALEGERATLETARRRGAQLGRRVDHQIDRFDEVRRLALQLWHERPRAVRAAIRSTLRQAGSDRGASPIGAGTGHSAASTSRSPLPMSADTVGVGDVGGLSGLGGPDRSGRSSGFSGPAGGH